jgi:hypothetical protein
MTWFKGGDLKLQVLTLPSITRKEKKRKEIWMYPCTGMNVFVRASVVALGKAHSKPKPIF